MKQTPIYILGNKIITKDNLALKLLPILQKKFSYYSFIHLDPTEEIADESNLILIDTVEGISKTTLFTDITSFEKSPRVSVHDYDLLLELSLRKKLHRISSFKIIGLPAGGNIRQVAKDVMKIFSSILPLENVTRSSCRDHML